MTQNPYAQFIFDAGPLARSGCDFAVQRLMLRTAVSAGVRWVVCPSAEAQSLVGRALFDLPQVACAVAFAEPDPQAFRDATVRLRRARVDLALFGAATREVGAFCARFGVDGLLGEFGLAVETHAQFAAALRRPSLGHLSLGPGIGVDAWADPAVVAHLYERPWLSCFASPALLGAPGVTGVVFAPETPHALALALSQLRPRAAVDEIDRALDPPVVVAPISEAA